MSSNRPSILSSVGGGGIGGSSSGGLMGETLGIPETIKIEHTFTLNIADKVWSNLYRVLGGGTGRDSTSKAVRHTVKQILDLAKDYAESFHFIAVGIGSYFFLLGVAKVLEAGADHRSQHPENHVKKGGSSRKKPPSSSSSSHKQDGTSSDDRSTLSGKTQSSSRRRRPASTDSSNDERTKTHSKPSTIVTSMLEDPQTLGASAATTTNYVLSNINTETASEILAEFRDQTNPDDENVTVNA